MKNYNKKKLIKFPTNFEVIKKIVKKRIEENTITTNYGELDSFAFDYIKLEWIHKTRMAFTFTIKGYESNITYDILYPECQVVSISNGLYGINNGKANEYTKIIFKGFKKTPEYKAIPKEKRIDK
jgi:hypothetical protein